MLAAKLLVRATEPLLEFAGSFSLLAAPLPGMRSNPLEPSLRFRCHLCNQFLEGDLTLSQNLDNLFQDDPTYRRAFSRA